MNRSEDKRIIDNAIQIIRNAMNGVEVALPLSIYKECIDWLEKQGTDISLFLKEQQKYMEKYISLDKVTLIKLLAERDRNTEEITKSFEK
jgi:hypothetical protein